MRLTHSFVAFLATSTVLAGTLQKRAMYSGIATFNNYAGQHNTVCGPKSATAPGAHGAATADYSGHISPGHCANGPAQVNYNLCTSDGGTSAPGPACPAYNANPPGKGNGKGCGVCYRITNEGSADPKSTIGGKGKSTTVQIIDACPAYHPQNYCVRLSHSLLEFG